MKWLLLIVLVGTSLSTATREIRTPQQAVDMGLPFDGRLPKRVTTLR